jgi:hypothetical protein
MSGPTIVATITANDEASARLRALAEVVTSTAKQLDKMGASNKLAQNLKESEAAALANERAFGRMHAMLGRVGEAAKSMARQVAQAAAMVAGPIILGGVKHGLQGGAEIQTQDLRNVAAGMTPAERRQADDQARVLSRDNLNLGVAELIQLSRETRSVLRDKSEAPAMMPVIAEAASAMKALGMGLDGLPFALKGAELLGDASDPKRLTNYLDSFVKARETLGTLITAEDQFQFAKQSRASGFQFSDRFATQMGPLMSAEMGGETAGTVLNAFEKVMRGGGAMADYKNMIALGLANESDFIKDKTGQIHGLKLGHHIKDSDLAATDPDRYINEKLVPALIAHGAKSVPDQLNEIRQVFRDRTSQDAVIKLFTQAKSFESHLVALNQAMGLSAAQMLVHTDATLALSAAETQLEGLFSEMTNPAMGVFAQGLAGVAEGLAWAKSGIHSLAEWAPKSAAALSALTTSAIALGGGWLTMKTFLNFMGLGGAQAKLGAAGIALDGSAAALDASAAALNEAAAVLATGGKAGAVEGGAIGLGEKTAAAGGVGFAAKALGLLGDLSIAGTITAVAYGTAKTIADYFNSKPTPLGKAFNDSDDAELARQQRKLDAMDRLQRYREAHTPIGLGAIAPPADLVPKPGEMAPYNGPWLSRDGKPLDLGPLAPDPDWTKFGNGSFLPTEDSLHPKGGGLPSLSDLGAWLVKEMPSVFSRPDKPVDVQGKVSGDAELHITVDASGVTKTQTTLNLDGTIGQSATVPSGRNPWSAAGGYAY